MDSAPRVLDMFCGVGGLTLGLQRAGLQSIGGVDVWSDAARTFAANHDGLRCLVADIVETTAERLESFFNCDIRKVDVLSGGPPCQGFSTVGKRRVDDPRNGLWQSYLRLVAELRPAYVLIENVEGLKVMKNGGICESIIQEFGRAGYRMKARLVRSADYGVPQLRKRMIFLGWLDGLAEPAFPTPTHTVEDYVSVGDAIFDLPELQSGERKCAYDNDPTTVYQRSRRGNARQLHNHEAARHPPHLVEILKHIPDGGNRRSIPDRLQPRSGFHNSYARLSSVKPAVAITSNMRKPSSARSTHPKQHRGLTVREGLRLQSFDDTFVVLGSRTSQYVQVGNAVPPLLAEAVGRELIAAWRNNRRSDVDSARSRPAVALPVPRQLAFLY